MSDDRIHMDSDTAKSFSDVIQKLDGLISNAVSGQTNATQLALLVQKVDALTTQVTRLADDHESRIRLIETSITKLGERITLFQGVQIIFATIAAAIAAIIGRQ